MWQVSDPAKWDAAIRAGHTMATEIDVLYDRQPVEGGTGLLVQAGSVTFDANAEVRGRCRVDLAEPFRVPVGPTDLLSPYGFEIVIRRGVVYDDGTSEMVPLGVFGIQVSDTDGETLLTTITGEDRTRQVLDAPFEDDVEIVPGTNVADAIEAVIASGVDGLEYLLPVTTHTVLQGVLAAESSRWTPAYDMATSVGWDIFFNGLGQLEARPETTFAQDPVWIVDEADENGEGGVLLGVKLRMDRTTAYNRHPVKSSNAAGGAVFSAVAIDDDPASPTYFYGPFGRKSAPVWVSEWISSDDMALDAALARLARGKGVARKIDWSAVPNCALQVGDVVHVKREALGVNELQIIESLTIGLAPEDRMTGSRRVQQ